MHDPARHSQDSAADAPSAADGPIAVSTAAADSEPGRHGHAGHAPVDHVHASHPAIVARLKRAEGHLRKIIAMFGDGRACVDLAQQLHAVEAAIGAAKHELIHDHIEHCLAMSEDGASEDGASPRAVLAELKAITKYL